MRSHIYHYVTCRKLGQKMADLPEEKSSDTTPFIEVGMDVFGPFVTKEGRKELKCAMMLSLHALLVGPYTLKM